MKKALMILSLAALGAAPFFAQAESQTTTKSREEVHQAFDECRETLGLQKPEPGQRPVAPSEEERTKMDACLAGKGVKISDLHGKGHHRRPQAEDGGEQVLPGQ